MFVQSGLVGRRLRFPENAPIMQYGPNRFVKISGRTAKILAIGLHKNSWCFLACIEFEDKPQMLTIGLDGDRGFEWLETPEETPEEPPEEPPEETTSRLTHVELTQWAREAVNAIPAIHAERITRLISAILREREIGRYALENIALTPCTCGGRCSCDQRLAKRFLEQLKLECGE